MTLKQRKHVLLVLAFAFFGFGLIQAVYIFQAQGPVELSADYRRGRVVEILVNSLIDMVGNELTALIFFVFFVWLAHFTYKRI